MKKIGILGSTGSIGTQTIEVCRELDIEILSLTTNVNIELLEKQAREFNPKVVAVYNEEKAKILQKNLADTNILVLSGMNGLVECAKVEDADTILTAVVGMVGLKPTIEAINCGKDIALANKETLVCAGEIVMRLAKEKNIKILPVDSEHSAIFQSLQGSNEGELKKVILTASGGPFRGFTDLTNITKEQALKHPNWEMGAKITIDSATLMNKGLEFIEAYWLFGTKNIEVVVHPQSIIHSLVEYNDNSVIAQLGTPNMKLPIQYALTYPKRIDCKVEQLDLIKCANLSFFEPDELVFKCLRLAKECAFKGGNSAAILNSANEQAVELFLADKIKFYQIADAVEYALEKVEFCKKITLEDVFLADKLARNAVNDFVQLRK
ncbi:MAG: 1-deoxy-D-xylulose-5-phosphate reductoisomerase [Clostridia bacterium]